MSKERGEPAFVGSPLLSVGVVIAACTLLPLAFTGTAFAAPPQVVSISVSEGSITSTGVTLQASINPNGVSTTYRFEYLTEAAIEGNLGAQPPREPFDGAALAPTSGAGLVGSGTSPVTVSQHISGLVPATSYRYRVHATNSSEQSVDSASSLFVTADPTNVPEPPDPEPPDPEAQVPCIGDACQALPEPPEDPTPGTLVPNSGNPPLKVSGAKPKPKHRKRKRRKHKARGHAKGARR